MVRIPILSKSIEMGYVGSSLVRHSDTFRPSRHFFSDQSMDARSCDMGAAGSGKLVQPMFTPETQNIFPTSPLSQQFQEVEVYSICSGLNVAPTRLLKGPSLYGLATWTL